MGGREPGVVHRALDGIGERPVVQPAGLGERRPAGRGRYDWSTAGSDHPHRSPPPSLPVRLAISWLTNALVLAVVAAVLSAVTVSGAWALLLAAAVFGVLNTLLKPLLRLVTLPLAIVTFGIAWFFVSLLMLALTKALVSGFYITGFWTLVKATLIIWIVNLALDFTPGPWQITGHRRRLNPGR